MCHAAPKLGLAFAARPGGGFGDRYSKLTGARVEIHYSEAMLWLLGILLKTFAYLCRMALEFWVLKAANTGGDNADHYDAGRGCWCIAQRSHDQPEDQHGLLLSGRVSPVCPRRIPAFSNLGWLTGFEPATSRATTMSEPFHGISRSLALFETPRHR